MKEQDRAEFAELLSQVLGFYKQNISPFALSVWWQACKPFELSDIRAAVTAHATDPKHGHFAPMPADVIRNLRGDYEELAMDAWANVLRVACDGGAGSAGFDDVTRQALETLGGLGAVQRGDESENSFLQKRFMDAYKAYHAREEREERISISNDSMLMVSGAVKRAV